MLVDYIVEGLQQRENEEECVERDDFSFGKERENGEEKVGENKVKVMPPTSVMTRLILIMVWRKLIRNPNTYSSLIGLTWSLVSFRLKFYFFYYFLCFWFYYGLILIKIFTLYRWNVEMPAIIAKSISILSDAGLGMAMFSLGDYSSI